MNSTIHTQSIVITNACTGWPTMVMPRKGSTHEISQKVQYGGNKAMQMNHVIPRDMYAVTSSTSCMLAIRYSMGRRSSNWQHVSSAARVRRGFELVACRRGTYCGLRTDQVAGPHADTEVRSQYVGGNGELFA